MYSTNGFIVVDVDGVSQTSGFLCQCIRSVIKGVATVCFYLGDLDFDPFCLGNVVDCFPSLLARNFEDVECWYVFIFILHDG